MKLMGWTLTTSLEPESELATMPGSSNLAKDILHKSKEFILGGAVMILEYLENIDDFGPME